MNVNKKYFQENLKSIYDPSFISVVKGTIQILENHNLKISIAESISAGNINKIITSFTKKDNQVEQNFITYSNDSKIRTLGVNPETIEKYDPVSKEVAEQMAENLIKKTKSDISIITTGYAGKSGNEKLGISGGTVFIAISYRVDEEIETEVRKFNFQGGRRENISKTSIEAILFLRDILSKNYSAEIVNTLAKKTVLKKFLEESVNQIRLKEVISTFNQNSPKILVKGDPLLVSEITSFITSVGGSSNLLDSGIGCDGSKALKVSFELLDERELKDFATLDLSNLQGSDLIDKIHSATLDLLEKIKP